MSAQAKKRLVSALVSLARASKSGGYFGLSKASGGVRRRGLLRAPRTRRKRGGALSEGGSLGMTNIRSVGGRRGVRRRRGGALVGGSQGGSLGMTNIRSVGGRRRATRKRGGEIVGGKKRKPTGGQTKWISFVKKVQAKYRLTYRDALMKASDLKRQGHYR